MEERSDDNSEQRNKSRGSEATEGKEQTNINTLKTSGLNSQVLMVLAETIFAGTEWAVHRANINQNERDKQKYARQYHILFSMSHDNFIMSHHAIYHVARGNVSQRAQL